MCNSHNFCYGTDYLVFACTRWKGRKILGQKCRSAYLSNRLFAYYGRLGYDSKKAADMRIYQQEKICEKHNLSKENPFGSKGLFARYGKGPVGFYMAASSAVSVIFTGIAYVLYA